MSFYVTLPSNASFTNFPNNTQSNYTTVLNKPIIFDGQYEVAMTEISYPPNFNLNYGYVEFPYYELKYQSSTRPKFLRLYLNLMNALSKNEIADFINKLIETIVIKNEFLHRYDLAWNFNEQTAKDLKKFPKKLALIKNDLIELCYLNGTKYRNNKEVKVIDNYNLSYLKNHFFSDTDVLSIYVPEKNTTFKDFKVLNQSNPLKKQIYDQFKLLKEHLNIPVLSISDEGKLLIKTSLKIKLGGIIAFLLTEKEEHEFDKSQSFIFPDKTSIIYNAAIYIDIIFYQYFGDTQAPVLRSINLSSSATTGVVKSFENPMYLPVIKTFISKINIKIDDLQGNLLKFIDDFGFVIVTLHFRK